MKKSQLRQLIREEINNTTSTPPRILKLNIDLSKYGNVVLYDLLDVLDKLHLPAEWMILEGYLEFRNSNHNKDLNDRLV